MYIIAEIAQAHDGSLGNALNFIKAAKKAGANAVKFQHHIASEESTKKDKFRVNIFPQDNSRYEYWKRIQFRDDEWVIINKACKEECIDLIISPFSIKSVKKCLELDVKAFKIGSGEVNNYELLEACLRTGKMMIISSGMSTWNEIQKSFDFCRQFHNEITILQCTSKYPCPLSEVGLKNISRIRSKFNCSSGLSDHSGDLHVGMAACALGAEFLEVHICWNKLMFGPDTTSSLTIEQLHEICSFRDKFFEMKNEKDKDSIAFDLNQTKELFGRSLVASKSLKKGEIIDDSCIVYKKPGGGLRLDQKSDILKKRLIKDIAFDEPFKVDHFL